MSAAACVVHAHDVQDCCLLRLLAKQTLPFPISFIALANCEVSTTASSAFTTAKLPSSYCLRHANTFRD